MDDLSGEDKAPPAISVVIVAYNSAATLSRCVEGLAHQTLRDFELLIVDNDSPQGEAAPAAEGHAFARLVRAGGNLGFAGGVNLGAREARGRWLVLLNPDAYPDVCWLEALAEAARRHPKVRAFTSRQVMAEDPSLLDGLGDVMSAPAIPYRGGYLSPDPGDTPEGEVFSPCGAAMMVDRRLFLDLGGLDESFFCYNEDVDLAFRARLLGHRAIQLREAAVDHMGYASSGRRSEFATYYGVRNRTWVFLKNTPDCLLIVLLPLHVSATLAMWVSSARFGQAGVFGRAIKDAISGWRELRLSRRSVQAEAKVGSWAIARAMAWNPWRLVARSTDVRPYKRV